MTNEKLRFIDLFAGIGGFRLAFESVGYDCVYSCEIDENCRKVYFNNFQEIPDQDIRKIAIHDLPDFEVLTAGFPCQPFSISGKRAGFRDTRGTLFFHICEIVELKKPKIILLENVKHLIHLDKGKNLDIILHSLEELGYLVDYKLLNAKDFGVPQNRERIIIIATQNKKFNFNSLKYTSPIPKLRDFLSPQGNFEYLDKKEYTLIDNPTLQPSGLIFVGYRNKTIWKKGIRPNTEHLSRVHHQPNRIYSIDGVHPTIPSQETSGRFFIYIPEQDQVRKLTIQECYRLMKFPDSFQIHPNLAESYKQVGNSVCIPMIQELAIAIKKHIFENNSRVSLKEFSFSRQNIQLEIIGLDFMNHKEKLLEIYDQSLNLDDRQPLLPQPYQNYIQQIATNCSKQKAVYTVLITLLVHKILYPNQDIRYHQTNLPGGFSGRTIDTQYITPTLKQLGLPAMAESGWLTRSLEQPFPYTLDYQGKISNQKTKDAFLGLIDFIETNPQQAEVILRLLLHQVNQIIQTQKIKILKIDNPEPFDINTLSSCLENHFSFNYQTRGASKLPVLALYAIYQRLIIEVERYKSCTLKPLGSHTASDLTSGSAGDIEIFDKNKQLVEVIEIKHGKYIDLQILRIAKDKIIKFNPRRYYILSSFDVKPTEVELIMSEIQTIKNNHGCQIITNGIIPTIKYYLRLISSPEEFVNSYSHLIEIDSELQTIHKLKWNEILSNLISPIEQI
jgi:DNA (cytosine-5)-methyltransferase 1